MDKRELVELTVERLLAFFEKSPESFDLKLPSDASYGGPTVTWRPRIQLGSYDSNIVDDPNNHHAVVIIYNPNFNELICNLFIKAPSNLDTARADYSVTSRQTFMKFRSHYRKFKRLIKLIKARDLHRENMTYLSKLSSVFPDTLDKHILKD
jgi:hypothetical protein